MNKSTGLFIGAGLGLAALAGLWWLLRSDKFNPTSDKNLAYGGVNSAGAALTGDKDFTLGGWLYDLFHPEYDPNAPAGTVDDAPRADANVSNASGGNVTILSAAQSSPYGFTDPRYYSAPISQQAARTSGAVLDSGANRDSIR